MASRQGSIFRVTNHRIANDVSEWFVTLRWAFVSDRLEVVSIDIWRGARPADPAGLEWRALPRSAGPTAVGNLRDIPLGRVIEEERHRLRAQVPGWDATAEHFDETDPALAAYVREQAKAWRPPASSPTRKTRGRGRPPAYNDDDLLEVAQIYLSVHDGSALKAIQERFHFTDRRSAGRLVKKAEEARFLSSAAPGQRRQAGPRYPVDFDEIADRVVRRITKQERKN